MFHEESISLSWQYSGNGTLRISWGPGPDDYVTLPADEGIARTIHLNDVGDLTLTFSDDIPPLGLHYEDSADLIFRLDMDLQAGWIQEGNLFKSEHLAILFTRTFTHSGILIVGTIDLGGELNS